MDTTTETLSVLCPHSIYMYSIIYIFSYIYEQVAKMKEVAISQDFFSLERRKKMGVEKTLWM